MNLITLAFFASSIINGYSGRTFKPSFVQIAAPDDEPVATISMDGQITIGKGHTAEEAVNVLVKELMRIMQERDEDREESSRKLATCVGDLGSAIKLLKEGQDIMDSLEKLLKPVPDSKGVPSGKPPLKVAAESALPSHSRTAKE